MRLDRFSQDPQAAAIAMLHKEEPRYCYWCNGLVYGDKEIHTACEHEKHIQEMPFGDFFNHLFDHAPEAEVVPEYKDGAIEFRVYFENDLDKQRFIKLLVQRDVVHFVSGDMVMFAVLPGFEFR